MQLAVALYNNNVDIEDELEFNKGDILTVLIENPNGFDGWWLCKHKDKCGLCPGNRLKLIQNTTSSITPNDFVHSYSRLSTASMYDSLSSNYDNPVITSSSNHDYDNPQGSDFISNLKSNNFSPESSSRSSGIYSTNDLHLSSSSASSSSEFYTTTINNNSLSSINLNQLQNSFQKYSIHSSLLDKYRQLISKTNIQSNINSFINECQIFLHNYGYLLDRYTYKLIKENILYELESNKKRIIQLSTKIIQLIDLQLKEKSSNYNDLFKKLHLEPIEEIPNDKLNTSLSTTQIYGNFLQKNFRSTLKNSKTCHSKFFLSSLDKKLDENNYSLIKCYYRHINEQVDLIIKRYSYLLENENKISLIINDGKALIVAGYKLIFVLETLHEHLRQIQTSLIHLTRQLCEALTNFIQLIKQFSQQKTSTNIQKLIIEFKQDIKIIMNLVNRIKQQCTLI